jgi:HD superfamily phosphohydrolase
MIPAALLHDIGTPFSAYQTPEDIPLDEYSFTDHEELSYQMIKEWPFVSDYTKQLVRWHYLIRDIAKHKTKDPARYEVKQKIWEGLSPQMQEDLKRFLTYDDLGKGERK